MNANDIATKNDVMTISENISEMINKLSTQNLLLDVKVSTKEAARLIGVHHRTVRTFVERGSLTPVDCDSKSYEFWLSEVNRHMKTRL